MRKEGRAWIIMVLLVLVLIGLLVVYLVAKGEKGVDEGDEDKIVSGGEGEGEGEGETEGETEGESDSIGDVVSELPPGEFPQDLFG